MYKTFFLTDNIKINVWELLKFHLNTYALIGFLHLKIKEFNGKTQ